PLYHFFLVMFCTQAVIMIERGIWYYFSQSRGFDVLQVVRLQGYARGIVDSRYKCERRFYSAEPLFLLDDKVQYPRELVTGPFLLFLGRRDITRIGKDFDVTERINRWKPDVVIWGYFPKRKPRTRSTRLFVITPQRRNSRSCRLGASTVAISILGIAPSVNLKSNDEEASSAPPHADPSARAA